MSSERIGNLREPFDPDRHFITVKAFSCAGVVYGPGQPFGKDQTSPRKLRQLYEGRYLRQVEPTIGLPPIDTDPHTPEMIDSLQSRALAPRKKIKRVRFLEA